MFDGGRGYGRPVAGEAMDAAIARCRETGVVAMTLANAHHIGRVDWLKREIDGFIDYVKASPPADPKLPVLVPGEPERLAQAERSRAGIEVDATTWGEILAAAEAVGLSRAEAAALGG